jgi:hypothetical protein
MSHAIFFRRVEVGGQIIGDVSGKKTGQYAVELNQFLRD